MLRRKQLDHDEDAAHRERDQAVDERPAEAHAADRRRAHAAEEDQLPFVVERLARHERVERDRRLVHGNVVVDHLQMGESYVSALTLSLGVRTQPPSQAQGVRPYRDRMCML